MYSKAKGWNGGMRSTGDRLESDLTEVDPINGEIKKKIHLSEVRIYEMPLHEF
jgi:hypothetical protein